MNNIRNSIFRTIIEMVAIVIVLIASYFWWDNLEATKLGAYAQEASKSTVMDLTILRTMENYSFFPISDEKALENITPGVIRIDNYSATTRNCSLVFMVDKMGTSIDYRLIKLSIDNDVYSLNSMSKEEDDEYMYFIFNADNIKEYKAYNIRIWLDEDALKEDFYRKNLEYAFSLKDNSLLSMQ